jgi:hypothetical protein
MVDLKSWVFGGNPLQRSGSGSEVDPELNAHCGPIANTTVEETPQLHVIKQQTVLVPKSGNHNQSFE